MEGEGENKVKNSNGEKEGVVAEAEILERYSFGTLTLNCQRLADEHTYPLLSR